MGHNSIGIELKTVSQKRADDRARQQRHRKYRAAGVVVAHVQVGPEVQEMFIRNGWLRADWTSEELDTAVCKYLKARAVTTSALPKVDVIRITR